MPRVRGGFKTNRRRKKWVDRAKGYRGVSGNVYKKCRERVEYALNQSFRGRKQKKRDMRQLWIIRINAAARLDGLSYSALMGGLKKKNIALDRKVLADIAVRSPKNFSDICKYVNA